MVFNKRNLESRAVSEMGGGGTGGELVEGGIPGRCQGRLVTG